MRSWQGRKLEWEISREGKIVCGEGQISENCLRDNCSGMSRRVSPDKCGHLKGHVHKCPICRKAIGAKRPHSALPSLITSFLLHVMMLTDAHVDCNHLAV